MRNLSPFLFRVFVLSRFRDPSEIRPLGGPAGAKPELQCIFSRSGAPSQIPDAPRIRDRRFSNLAEEGYFFFLAVFLTGLAGGLTVVCLPAKLRSIRILCQADSQAPPQRVSSVIARSKLWK